MIVKNIFTNVEYKVTGITYNVHHIQYKLVNIEDDGEIHYIDQDTIHESLYDTLNRTGYALIREKDFDEE